jgi:hypothetical protein
VLLLTDEVAGSAAMNGRRGSEDEEVAADGFEGLGLPPEDPDADLGKLAPGAESKCTAAAEAGNAAFAVLWMRLLLGAPKARWCNFLAVIAANGVKACP